MSGYAIGHLHETHMGPEIVEYLERIEAVVAVVNHRHGTPDWMPIQLKLRDDLEEAVAAYKHYDVLLVNLDSDGDVLSVTSAD